MGLGVVRFVPGDAGRVQRQRRLAEGVAAAHLDEAQALEEAQTGRVVQADLGLVAAHRQSFHT